MGIFQVRIFWMEVFQGEEGGGGGGGEFARRKF